MFPAVCFWMMGLVHYLGNSQVFFFSKILIKTGSHGTIYAFKNYFVTVFLVIIKLFFW